MEGTAFFRRLVLIGAVLWLAAPGTPWAMDAGVVRIESDVRGKTRFGSGFVVRTEGDAVYVATAAHVVEGDAAPRVYFQVRPHRAAKARVLAVEGADPRGLALLLVESGVPVGVEALPMAEGGGYDVKPGEAVRAVGIPAGLRAWAVIPGAVVSWKNRNILFSGGVDEGNSGGPLTKGQAVAGLVMGVERGLGVAVPAMSLRIFLQSNGVAWDVGTQVGRAQVPPQLPALVGASTEKTLSAPAARKPGETFRDCDECPEMVVIPAGSFRMGSPDSEQGRDSDEGPVHTVRIDEPFALARGEVTVGQFRAFVEATGHRTEAEKGGGCYVWDGSQWSKDPKRNWRSPGFVQGEDHPVVCVSWNDARAYVGWLGKETGQTYRLPSEAEWEYAARAGTTTARFWGERSDRACDFANVADKSLKGSYPDFQWTIHDCDDRFVHTAPVGTYQANNFGLRDMLGNAWEWTEDCWNDSYKGASADGRAWSKGDCGRRVVRGGSWNHFPGFVRSAFRFRLVTDFGYDLLGFRPARTF